MGKMRELLESDSSALFGILGDDIRDDIRIYVANASPTMCKITVIIDHQKYEREASIGQLRALSKEAARATNNLLEIQKITPHQKIVIDGETPL